MANRPDPERLRAAVSAVLDPELGRPLGELGMIGELATTFRGRVRVQLRLTTETCPLVAELRRDVEAAVHTVTSAAVSGSVASARNS